MLRTLMQHKFIVLGVGVLAAIAIWYGLSQSSTPATTIVTTGPNGTSNTPGGVVTAGPVDKDTQKILEVLLALRAVKLDDSIFTSNAFITLKDFSTRILPEPVGRPDPFAPLSGLASSSALVDPIGLSAPAPAPSSALTSPPSSPKLKALQKLQAVPSSAGK